jgi:hypothetical protein
LKKMETGGSAAESGTGGSVSADEPNGHENTRRRGGAKVPAILFYIYGGTPERAKEKELTSHNAIAVNTSPDVFL